ncbi:DUF1433 domain-containing protein [Staphylococcus epidermidis]|uniref:DUF1433 domain-containing protein n=1 Tax=Staphylococcus epidermidis TaxID=1282 RepID=UPI003F8840EF|nr:DUF1433 domain-containing protein [Staphylococcus epidermidis]MCG1993015.1 DUF1433 domain-containing protein [Staphylococcus epidermidis]MCG1997503.1 DUF1433 domain-containing protein [Staphylococcus epidermidis]
MLKKKILIFISIIFIILIIIGGVYLKMKYDEREKQKEIYYKEQQERISLYLKNNTKEPNTIKSVNFTKLENSPMGSAVIKGYINNKKEDDFVAYASPENNFQFVGDMIKSQGVDKLLKIAHERKSPDEIKKELDKKKDH